MIIAIMARRRSTPSGTAILVATVMIPLWLVPTEVVTVTVAMVDPMVTVDALAMRFKGNIVEPSVRL